MLAFAKAVPKILFQIYAELGFVGAFVDGTRAAQGVAAAFEVVEQVIVRQHLFHCQPGTDVAEINERFLFSGHGIISFEGSMRGSGIELRPMDDDTMPARKIRDVENSIEQTNRIVLTMGLPAHRK